jgi:hypothetical protein
MTHNRIVVLREINVLHFLVQIGCPNQKKELDNNLFFLVNPKKIQNLVFGMILILKKNNQVIALLLNFFRTTEMNELRGPRRRTRSANFQLFFSVRVFGSGSRRIIFRSVVRGP